jgi:preprotein translocase subunit SecG
LRDRDDKEELNRMIGLLTAFHVLVAVFLILGVLLQSARGADLAGAFGGMGSQTAFGPRGTATFLSKATVVLAVVFMMTSLTLAILSNRVRGAAGDSVLRDEPAVPAVPGATPPAVPGGIQPNVQLIPEPVSPAPAPGAPAPTQTAPAPATPPAQAPANPPAQVPPSPPAP